MSLVSDFKARLRHLYAKLSAKKAEQHENSSPLPPERDRHTRPVSVHFEYLQNVSKTDAIEYALGHLRSRSRSSRTFYGVFAFGNGFIVELHEGGAGKAYLPAILAQMQEAPRDFEAYPLKVRLQSGQESWYLRITTSSFSCMALPEGMNFDTDMEAPVSEEALQRAEFRHSRRLLRASGGLLLVSLMVYGGSLLSRPEAPRLSIEPVHAYETALYHWINNIGWPASEQPTTVRFKASGQEAGWSLETRPLFNAAEFNR